MKKLIVFILSVVLFGSCTVTHYSGEIYPNKVEFNKANFKYLKTIKGSATAKYNSYGWDRNKADGLINEAKSNMYLNHSFQPNQVVANITKDVLRVTDTRGFGSREIKVIVTGDVFEFSENGIYSGQQKVEKSEGLNVVNGKITKSTSTSPYFKYNKTPKVSDVVYFENYYTKKFDEGIVVGYVKGSSNVTLEFKNSKNKLKRKFISIDLLFQKK
jgi:hypothetical protein